MSGINIFQNNASSIPTSDSQIVRVDMDKSDIGKDILKAINMLVKHVPSGAVTPADEKANLERMQMQNTQNGQMQQQMKAGAAQGGQPPQAAAA